MAQSQSEAPEFVESMAEYCHGKVVGMSDDKKRIGIQADKVSSNATSIAMRNGYVVDEVRQNGMGSGDYQLHITFTRMGFDA